MWDSTKTLQMLQIYKTLVCLATALVTIQKSPLFVTSFTFTRLAISSESHVTGTKVRAFSVLAVGIAVTD